ncbi:hypothetical protein [Candidatus Albibeggiatoa sp. nov. BB20]|uniref:hypothetical protein n=1 Tax=Candidatus Albibeggiatoa sp. nov. BB20 TaxID=3162723 RepID=UPI003365831A
MMKDINGMELFIILIVAIVITYLVYPTPEKLNCTYAVWVKDSENKVLSNAKVTYIYNQKHFSGYLDSDGFYRATMTHDENTCPEVKLIAEKEGYETYTRQITHNLKRIEEIKLKKIDKLEEKYNAQHTI